MIRTRSLHIMFISILAGFIIIFSSCDRNKDRQAKSRRQKFLERKEPMMNANRMLVRKDHEIIESYVKRRGWNMTLLENGLWYDIYEKTDKQKVENRDIITIHFTVSLLDGTLCYDSDSLGPKTFKVGQSDVEHGLQEGVLLMREGEKAKFIMPPFLAHGLLGDEKKIPPRSIILYDVYVENINKTDE